MACIQFIVKVVRSEQVKDEKIDEMNTALPETGMG